MLNRAASKKLEITLWNFFNDICIYLNFINFYSIVVFHYVPYATCKQFDFFVSGCFVVNGVAEIDLNNLTDIYHRAGHQGEDFIYA